MSRIDLPEKMLREVCLRTGLDITEVTTPGQRRVQVIPRRALAVEVRRVVGWTVARTCATFNISKTILFHASPAHDETPLGRECRAAARNVVAEYLDELREEARDDANERLRGWRSFVRDALAKRAAEHMLRPEQVVNYRGLLQHEARRSSSARRAVVLDSIAAGVPRCEVAKVLGLWPESVVRIVTRSKQSAAARAVGC